MLITRWPRLRSLPNRLLCPLEQHVQQGYHNTHARIRYASSKNRPVQPLYIDTTPPTPEQLHASEVFFRTHLPTKSWTATEWRQQPHSESAYLIPEVAFLGRSNSGKSSLLNGLLFDEQLCRVGAKPGKTITMHAWSLSPIDPKTRGARKGYQGDMEPKLTVLDMPGYGHGSHGEWGAAIMKYLTARRQLRRAFVLINPLHGLKEQDLQMLELLRGHGIPHQLIACKSDRIKNSEAPALFASMQAEIDKYFSRKRETPLLMTIKDILTVGGLAQTKDSSKWLEFAQGLHNVRWAILRAAGLDEYATILAANGGQMPKTKVAQLAPVEQSTSDHQKPFRSESSTRHDSNASLTTDEAPGHNHIPTILSQNHFAPQHTPSIGISVEDLLSETYSPLSSQSNSSKSDTISTRNTGDRHNVTKLPARSASAHRRVAPPRQPSYTPTTKTGQLGSRKIKAIPDGRTSRTKDVRRYGGGKR